MDYLDYTDLVLLYDKGFTHELFSTLWGTDKSGAQWCVEPEALGGYLMFHPVSKDLRLGPQRTMTREEFTEIFG